MYSILEQIHQALSMSANMLTLADQPGHTRAHSSSPEHVCKCAYPGRSARPYLSMPANMLTLADQPGHTRAHSSSPEHVCKCAYPGRSARPYLSMPANMLTLADQPGHTRAHSSSPQHGCKRSSSWQISQAIPEPVLEDPCCVSQKQALRLAGTLAAE